jgi:hypothetical protein
MREKREKREGRHARAPLGYIFGKTTDKLKYEAHRPQKQARPTAAAIKAGMAFLAPQRPR